MAKLSFTIYLFVSFVIVPHLWHKIADMTTYPWDQCSYIYSQVKAPRASPRKWTACQSRDKACGFWQTHFGLLVVQMNKTVASKTEAVAWTVCKWLLATYSFCTRCMYGRPLSYFRRRVFCAAIRSWTSVYLSLQHSKLCSNWSLHYNQVSCAGIFLSDPNIVGNVGSSISLRANNELTHFFKERTTRIHFQKRISDLSQRISYSSSSQSNGASLVYKQVASLALHYQHLQYCRNASLRMTVNKVAWWNVVAALKLRYWTSFPTSILDVRTVHCPQ